MIGAFLYVPAMAAYISAAQPSGALPATPVLMPDRFEARVGEQLALALESTARAPVAWNAQTATWFFVRVAGTQENRDQPPPAAGAGGSISVPLGNPGVTMVGADFAVTNTRLTLNQLREVLDASVTPAERDKILKELPADKPVRVRTAHSVKSLVRVLPADPEAPIPLDAQTTVSKSGQFNEIRMILDPLNSLLGGDISVRLAADTDKAPRARLFATNLESGKMQDVVADGSGIALFHLREPGRWRLAFTTARRLTGDETADVALYSASVTFAANRTEVPK